MKFTFLFTLLLFTQMSFAYIDRKGNGGDVLFCEDPQSEHHLTVLDTYEVRRLKKSIDFGDKKEWKTIAEDLLLRWKPVAPKRMGQYLQWLASFEEETFWDSGAIEDIPDHGHVILPRNCSLKQAALQRPDDILFPGHPRYEIDQTYWQSMSPQEQAALVTHELILREAINDVKQANSIPTRFLNGFLWSTSPNSVLYFQAFIIAGFSYAELGGGAVIQNTIASGKVLPLTKSGYPSEPVEVSEVLGPIELPRLYCEPERPYHKNPFGGFIGFNEQGFVTSIQTGDKEKEQFFSCLPSTLKMQIQVSGTERIWNLKGVLDYSDTPLIIERYENYFGTDFQLYLSELFTLTTTDAQLTVDLSTLRTFSFFDLPQFGILPVLKKPDEFDLGYSDIPSDNKDLFLGLGGPDDFIQTQTKRFKEPKYIRYCEGSPEWYLQTNLNIWTFNSNTGQWREGNNCYEKK